MGEVPEVYCLEMAQEDPCQAGAYLEACHQAGKEVRQEASWEENQVQEGRVDEVLQIQEDLQKQEEALQMASGAAWEFQDLDVAGQNRNHQEVVHHSSRMQQ